MKERITYVHDADEPFDISQLQVEGTSLTVKDLKASREDRLTFGFDELPQEIKSNLVQIERLHLRWSSSAHKLPSGPFQSHISPGLHVFLESKRGARLESLCPLLKKAFGESLRCTSVEESFTHSETASSEDSGITSLHYHQNLGSLADFKDYAEHVLCREPSSACLDRLAILAKAAEVDIDYDSNAQTLVVKAYQNSYPESLTGWSRIDNKSGSSKTEIGVLSSQDATQLDHIKLAGYLTVLGQDQSNKPTLFQFPSRHHSLYNSKYSASFLKPSGLHPKLRIEIDTSQLRLPQTENPESCSLNTYLTLPSTIFPDKYQLSNELLLTSLNLRGLRSVAGYTDLEAPDYATSRWGSNMLIELEPFPNTTTKSASTWQAEIPLHLRYLPPTDSSNGLSQTEIPWPLVFWACAVGKDTGKLNGNPFDRKHLGYDDHFDGRTVFYHLQPNSPDGNLMNILTVPVLDTRLLGKDTIYLELGTGVIVLAGWLWIVWRLFKGWYWPNQPSREVKQKKI